MKNLPETYNANAFTWRFVEQHGNWAIYRKDQDPGSKTSPSHEVVRTNVRTFPPSNDSWGTDGFSYCDRDSLGNARKQISKLLANSIRSKCKNALGELSPAFRGSVHSGVPATA